MSRTYTLALVIFTYLLHVSTIHSQTPKLWGLTPIGGANAEGTMFSINGDGSNFNVAHAFVTNYAGQAPLGQPLWANDNKLYGVTSAGGGPQQGVIFSYDTASGLYTVLFEFYDTLGKNPKGTLIQASDGFLYGTTGGYGFVGQQGQCTLFRFDPVNRVYTRLMVIGAPASDLVEGPGGKLFGTADTIIYSWNINTQAYQVEHTFNRNFLLSSAGAMVVSPFDGLLYGGALDNNIDSGVIYNFDPTNDSVHVLYHLPGFGYPCVFSPNNGMVIVSDSTIYGCTSPAGISCPNAAFLYSYNIRSNQFTNITTLEIYNSASTSSGVTLAPNGKIYCMASNLNMMCYDRQTQTLTQLFILDSCDWIGGGKLSLSPGGRFFGMSNFGGNCSGNDNGFLFSFSPDSLTYIKHFNFNSGSGYFPPGNLTCAANHKIYGSAELGGQNGLGSIFCYDPQSNLFNVVHNFDSATGASNGNWNFNLTSARNGKLYGVNNGTDRGALACIYSLDPVNNAYTVLYQHHPGDSLDYLSWSGLVQLPDGKLYGTAHAHSGILGFSTLFSFDPDSLIFRIIAKFPASTGQYPVGSAGVLGKNARLYFQNDVSIFSFDPTIDSITTVFTFNQSTGNYPFGSLVMGRDSMLYGVASGPYCGTFFRFNTDSNIITVLHGFGSIFDIGCAPWSGVMQASDGNFYGTTQHGGITLGQCSGGLIFKYDPVTDSFSYIHQFNYNDGITPQCVLLETPICQPAGNVLNQSICGGMVFNFQGQIITASGTYRDTLQGILGCDSIVILNLNVDTVTSGITRISPDSLYVTGNGAIQWIDCADNSVIAGATGNLFFPNATGTYKAVIINGSCTDTTACVSVTLSDISMANAAAVNVYPNPSSGKWQLSVTPDLIGAELRISDEAGRIVHQSRITNNASALELDTHGNIYLLHITSGDKVLVKKLIKIE